MSLEKIYTKDINRHIEGVIKADEQKYIESEVEEYVITDELKSQLDELLEKYIQTGYTNIGVWISGFFGCGKSHLLKMLSYIFDQKEINGKQIGQIYLDKLDDSDFELKNNLKKVIQINSESVLFNIDQKATDSDSLLPIFMKILNELEGYYSRDLRVARFERDLSKIGIYDDFKREYENLTDERWLEQRSVFDISPEPIARILSKIKGEQLDVQKEIIKKYTQKVNISIEDFADLVNEYITKKGDKHRLIFCVDEIGQFISGDTKLMLDLQTISETLATKCDGRAWLVVTSQGDIKQVVGSFKKDQSRDFSRIQARFESRINLSSRNVDEVIRKRLLDKKNEYIKKIGDKYIKYRSNLETIYHFGEESRNYHAYKDKNQFVDIYPFVPYQFDLFQSSIKELVKHNFFQGEYHPLGERSMLIVFQSVAQKLSNMEIGVVAPYDYFLDGICNTLNQKAQQTINSAERNLDEFEVRVLKVLFLIKYVDEIVSTVKNISILLIDELNPKIDDLRKKIQEALNKLVRQNYIKRISNTYEFLTDTERDIEAEIKSVEVDEQEERKFLSDILFSEVIQNKKIRYYEINKDYDYQKKVDDKIFSRGEHDMSINVITPFYGEEVSENLLSQKSIINKELVIYLNDGINLEEDIELHLQTRKYTQQISSSRLSEEKKQIINQKQLNNHERRKEIISDIKGLISTASIFLNGQKISTQGTAPKNIVNAFQDLVKITYPQLNRISDIEYKEDILANILSGRGIDMFDERKNQADKEVLNYIKLTNDRFDRVTLKKLQDHFNSSPYGWYRDAIICIVAKLYKMGVIEVEYNSEEVSDDSIGQLLKNSRKATQLIITPRTKISNAKIKELKDFCEEYFSQPVIKTGSKEIVTEFLHKLREEFKQLNDYRYQEKQYPFVKRLDEILDEINNLLKRKHNWFYNHIEDYKDKLLDAKKDYIQNIKSFFNGKQKEIYDNIRDFSIKQRDNIGYLNSDSVQKMLYPFNCDNPYEGGIIKDGKKAFRKVKEQLDQRIKKEKDVALEKFKKNKERLEGMTEFNELNDHEIKRALHPLLELKDKIEESNSVPVIQNYSNQIKNVQNEVIKNINEINKEKTSDKDIPETKLVSFSEMKTSYTKEYIEDENDVDEYIQSLKKKLLKEIRNKHKIIIDND